MKQSSSAIPGSAAVPGLAAKPIVDILAGWDRVEELSRLIGWRDLRRLVPDARSA
jgi:GrpB-like predicted nucleotidyltransferase (UPF0157 family)